MNSSTSVFYLVSLKRSLTELDVAFNTGIDDDAIPALVCLLKLRFLTLLDTRVGMPGLRRLCAAIAQCPYAVELEVPRQCEIYIDSKIDALLYDAQALTQDVEMGSKYVLHPEAPLISDPNAVSNLTSTALKHNLVAHSQYNSSISVEGTQDEMVERLRTLLETRRADMLVRQVLWKEDEDEDRNDDDSSESSIEVF